MKYAWRIEWYEKYNCSLPASNLEPCFDLCVCVAVCEAMITFIRSAPSQPTQSRSEHTIMYENWGLWPSGTAFHLAYPNSNLPSCYRVHGLVGRIVHAKPVGKIKAWRHHQENKQIQRSPVAALSELCVSLPYCNWRHALIELKFHMMEPNKLPVFYWIIYL